MAHSGTAEYTSELLDLIRAAAETAGINMFCDDEFPVSRGGKVDRSSGVKVEVAPPCRAG